MQGEDALTLRNFGGRTPMGKSDQGNRSITNSSGNTGQVNDIKRLIADWIWTASFMSDHFEKTVLYTVLGIMVGLLLLLSFILCLILVSMALRRRKKRRIHKRLSTSSRTNTSTQTAESSTLIPSPSEHDFGLELLRFMHNGPPPVKRDCRSGWMDALERQPLQAPLTTSAAPVATVESQHRLCIPVSSDRLCDSFQHESAHEKSWYSPSCKGAQSQAFCKPLNAAYSPFATNSPNQVSPSSSELSSRGLISNCPTRDHLGTPTTQSTCDQLHQPRGVSSFLQVQPMSYVKDMLPNSGQGPSELSSIDNRTNLEGSLIVLANASSGSKGQSRSLQNSPRDTGTTSFDSFYSNPNRHSTFRLTSRSTQMLSN